VANYQVWVTLRTVLAADALMVGLIRRGMSIASLSGGNVTSPGNDACLLAMLVTANTATRRPDELAPFMQREIQQVLMQQRASWLSMVVVVMGHEQNLVTWAGPYAYPNPSEVQREPEKQTTITLIEDQPSTTQPANQLDKMDAAIGVPDK